MCRTVEKGPGGLILFLYLARTPAALLGTSPADLDDVQTSWRLLGDVAVHAPIEHDG
jgi:hypothetical protein